MGKKGRSKGGSKGKGRSGDAKAKTGKPLDVFSDTEDGPGGGGDKMYEDADFMELEEDAKLSKALLSGSGRKNKAAFGRGNDDEEVYGLDDEDEEDIHLPVPPKMSNNDFNSDLEDEGDGGKGEDDAAMSWGQKKKHFYGGNPNEKNYHNKDTEEAGGKSKGGNEEIDEAEAEAEEGKILQLRQLQALDEEDFFDTFAADTPTSSAAADAKQQQKSADAIAKDDGQQVDLDLSKLSRKDRVSLFHRESPEFKGIMADFEEKVSEASERLQPILDLIADGTLPDGNPAAKYVRAKHQLILNYCANISAFLMFKTRRTSLKFHPITSRLVQFKQLLDQMKPLDQVMAPEIDKVLSVVSKAAAGNDAAARDAKNTAVVAAKKLRRMVAKHNGILKDKKKERSEAPSSKAASKPENKKRKRLQILGNGDDEEEEGDDEKVSSGKALEQLTFDEQKAIEMYEALKSKKAKMEGSDLSEEEEEDDKREAKEFENEGAEEDGDEEDERRGITYQIAKNKGLQPKRSKLQRNPRVKHRHKYEKAKVRRKGQVREVRKEVKKYSGEMTGINARVKKGVKLM